MGLVMQENYFVRVTKDYLVFSAAHFITYDGNVCERLQGHNYGVEAEVHGSLDKNHYVVDFIALRDALQKIVLTFDHRMLLPTEHDQIKVREQANEIHVSFEARRWVFPKDDCLLLPVANTTTELLARYIALELIAELLRQGIEKPQAVRIGVDENNGQWGYYQTR